MALISLLYSPIASADLSMENQSLNLVCSNDVCSLSTQAVGDSVLSGEERDANPAQPVTVVLEFRMSPGQTTVSLLPATIESMEFDLRISEDGLGITRPDLYVELILGPSTNAWDIEPPAPGNQEPYILQNADLDHSKGRILANGDEVFVRISFDIDQPVSWELHLAGESKIELPIEWSIDAVASNYDEPSSFSEPRSITLIGTNTEGGLMGADVDCFRFDVEAQLSSLTVTISWDSAPLEVEQSNVIPEFWDQDGRAESEPEIRTKYEGNLVVNDVRWMEPSEGEHTLCWTGMNERYQTYSFTGSKTIMGVGSTSPEEFTGDATWDTGSSQVGRTESASQSNGAGVMTIVAASISILVALSGYLMKLSSVWLPRFMLPISILLLLFGGIISPAISISNESPNPGEMTFDELLDKRLNRVYQGVINDDQGEFGPQWYGGFMGMNEGEQLKLMLSIKSFHPIGDGRWQIQAEELEDIDLDRLVFGKLNDGRLSDENEVRFILRSGRLLALDLLLLEALLVVDEEPRGDVVHIQWDMVSDPGMSSLSSPAWTSRPDAVSSEEWRKITTAVKPDLLSVSFCDCGIDAMELSIRSNAITANDLITPEGIETSNGLIPHDFWIAVMGFCILISAAFVEKERRQKGMAMARDILR